MEHFNDGPDIDIVNTFPIPDEAPDFRTSLPSCYMYVAFAIQDTRVDISTFADFVAINKLGLSEPEKLDVISDFGKQLAGIIQDSHIQLKVIPGDIKPYHVLYDRVSHRIVAILPSFAPEYSKYN